VAAGNSTVVVASDNRGKLVEIRQLLAALDLEVRAQSEFGITAARETASTFRENALLKARHAAVGTGLPSIADDSGLEVAALGGRPGVRSARFAGEFATDEENIDRLLAELRGLPETGRSANFRCVAVYLDTADDPAPLIAEGTWHGRILEVRSGRGGFGYDPVFFDPILKKTAAEMTSDEKNSVSHRGQALRELSLLILRQAGLT
jgi:XTP/dITP diphosphohydrolase